MIYVFTGNGKGKTTSAIGQAIRAIGQEKKVAMFQFIKSKDWPTGEEKTIALLKDNFFLEKGGKGFVGIMGDNLPIEDHKQAAKELLEKAQKAIFSKKFDLVILDEINVALHLNLIPLGDIILLAKELPKGMDLILTGRYAPKEIIDMADLATEFKEIKHPFQKGITGKRGKEF